MRKIFNLFVILFLLSQRCIGQNVNWVSSTEHSKWVINRPIKLQRFISSKFVDAEIFPGQKQQTIEGWGGCFNELGWDALQLLNIKEREFVLRALF